MSFIDSITPKNTEEIKPGLFIQKTGETSFRQVYPAAWDGKINWKNFIFGGSIIKPLVFFMILILLAYGYSSSTNACDEFQADPCKYLPNITSYCLDLDVKSFEFENGKGSDIYPLQNYP